MQDLQVYLELNKTLHLFQFRKTTSILSVFRKKKRYLTIETFSEMPVQGHLGTIVTFLETIKINLCSQQKYIKSAF